MTKSLKSDIDEIKQSISELERDFGSEKSKEKLKKIKAILSKFIT